MPEGAARGVEGRFSGHDGPTRGALRSAAEAVVRRLRGGIGARELRHVAAAAAVVQALENRTMLAADLQISEFMASNQRTLPHIDGNFYDWIEIHNAGDQPADLAGHKLTDDANQLGKWTFPERVVPAGGYVVVFASTTRQPQPGELLANFELDRTGEYLALVSPNGAIVSQFAPKYPNQEADVSYGSDPDAGDRLRYFATPTPGERNARAEVVINEIHYDPPIKTEQIEFIELHNPGSRDVDLTGAAFSKGVTYTFGAGAVLPAGGYLVLAENAAEFQAKFGFAPHGVYTGTLSNEGETLTLENRGGGTLDEVDYGAGFPWPTVGELPGHSIELINADLDNSVGGNWRSAPLSTGAPEATLIASGSQWSYRKGTSAASNPISAWRQVGFTENVNDGWVKNAATPIGYDNQVPMATTLADMMTGYASVYLRKTFTINDLAAIGNLRLDARWDDGFNAWINGHRVAWAQVPQEDMLHSDLAPMPAREDNNFVQFVLPNPSQYLRQGENVLAVQFHNVNTVDSSDGYFDARLVATSAGSSPTPNARNSVNAANAAPAMRQVTHTPQQPQSGEAVTITAKVSDPDGVAGVNLQYQLVDPGNYININDAAYRTNWTTLAMKDDGTSGDLTAGDGIYTVVLPGNLQTNRRLVRYKITATDTKGASVTGPYADDPAPNFAYYVYDGVPGWSGAVRPGVTPTVNFSAEDMNRLPVYQLISKKMDVADSQHLPPSTAPAYNGSDELWLGTFVYNGEVYDHVHYRARGGVWRYAMGKNKWVIDFHKNHRVQAYDNWGNPYPTKWDKIDMSGIIDQGDYWHRGEQGMFEAISFKLFNMVGVEAMDTHWAQFRVVDDAAESGPTQYDGDLWGMYLAIEHPDGNFLDQHGLPDGNLYRMQAGTGPGGGDLNNQGPTQPSDNSDLVNFTSTYINTATTDQWWEQNLELEDYYSYRAIVELIHHYDIDQGAGKNYFYYHNPETNKWHVLPWDVDLTWSDNMFGGGNSPFRDRVLPRPTFNVAYDNRVREIRDLLFNPDQAWQLIEEYANVIDPVGVANAPVDWDRMMWDYNPIMASSYVDPRKAGQGRFYAGGGGQVIPAPGGFRGMVQKMKNYVISRGAWVDQNIAADPAIPNKPTASYVGAAGFPEDGLRFRTTNFSDASGTFAALEWRVAEVTDPGAPAYDPTKPKKYEINAAWESGEITTFGNEITIPGTAVEDGHAYRVRVRMKDSTGRWSHWSEPVQFVAAQGNSLVRDSLRVTEVHYNPAPPPAGSAYTNEDFEFIELKNIGLQEINLKGVAFGPGITHTFQNDLFVPSGGHVVLAKNPTALASRYAGIIVAGTYTGSLDNGGEQIVLRDAAGQVIQDFTYDNNGTGWHASTDGDGYSLTVVDEGAATTEWSEPGNWRPSLVVHGTPGGDDSAIAPGTIIINEISTHGAGGADWIELRNTKAAPMNVGGWFLSDDPANLTKYKISANRTIAGNGYLVLTALDDFGSAFTLNELLGGRLYLSNANGQLAGSYRDSVDYGSAAAGVAIGWHAHGNGSDFTELASATLGAANAGPAIGPVVINEFMYNPQAIGASEYIELRNLTGAPVKLYDPANPQSTWQFSDGITFSFPQGAEIPAFGYVLVVPTDPDAFRTTDDIHPNVPVFGPYTGNLGNGGEKVTLSRPGAPVGLTVPYYRVDRVEYGSTNPWPTAPNGGGPALSKTNSAAYGNDAANWSAENPGGSVGRENFDAAAPTVSIPEVDPGAVNSVRVVFSELVRGFDLADLQLTRDGVNVPLTAAQTLSSNDGLTYVLGNLAQLTSQPGEYVVRVLTAGGVRDLAERPLTGGATRSFTVASSALALNGTDFNDNWYLKRVGEHIHVWFNADGSGSSVFAQPMGISFALNARDGNDTVTIDLAGGNIEFDEFVVTGSSGDDVIRVINGNGKVLTVGRVPMLDGERLDVGTADLKVLNATAGSLDGMLKTARDGTVRWQGPGIGTSAATPLTGLMAMQQGADALAKYTYNGDANGDGRVNADDYFRIDQGFLGQPLNPAYAQGDFNYDDKVNADDYFLIDQAFLGQGTPLGGAVTATASTPVAASAAVTATVEESKKALKRTRVTSSVFSGVRVRRSPRRAR